MEYQAFFSILGWPEERTRIHVARLESMIANMAGKSLKRDVKPTDFLYDPWADPIEPIPVTKDDQRQDLRNQFGLLKQIQDIRQRQGE